MNSLFSLGDDIEQDGCASTVPVLLPLALDTTYDYLPSEGEVPEPGDFVLVPIGPRKEIGVVWERDPQAKAVNPKKLKSIIERAIILSNNQVIEPQDLGIEADGALSADGAFNADLSLDVAVIQYGRTFSISNMPAAAWMVLPFGEVSGTVEIGGIAA